MKLRLRSTFVAISAAVLLTGIPGMASAEMIPPPAQVQSMRIQPCANAPSAAGTSSRSSRVACQSTRANYGSGLRWPKRGGAPTRIP
jgi:hypothetical protein